MRISRAMCMVRGVCEAQCGAVRGARGGAGQSEAERCNGTVLYCMWKSVPFSQSPTLECERCRGAEPILRGMGKPSHVQVAALAEPSSRPTGRNCPPNVVAATNGRRPAAATAPIRRGARPPCRSPHCGKGHPQPLPSSCHASRVRVCLDGNVPMTQAHTPRHSSLA